MRRQSAIPNVEQPATEKRQAHPSTAQLEAFGLGQMTDAEAALLEEHVAACETCYEVLRGLPDDTLMSALRSGAAGIMPGLCAQGPLPKELAEHSRYCVLELLGSGGMGAVYKAEHRLMQRPVALKIIHRHLVERPDAVERFRREVKAAARLCHPNIVTAHDAEQAGDTHFLVMEFVEGVSLVHLVHEKGPLPVAQACAYGRQAALGLQHANERGMVHRDIKPQNLMLTPVDQVKILDFGLAHFAEGGTPGDAAQSGDTALDLIPSALTQASTVMGTPDYMAPEQTTSGRFVDIRADIYSLGCTLYFLLTGRPPFPDGTLGEKLAAQRERQPRALREVRPEVPTALAQVVARMMAKDPAQRYQTPAEVADALAPFAREKRFAASRKWLAMAAAVLLVAAAGAALLSGFAPWVPSRGNRDLGNDSGVEPSGRASALPAHFALQVDYPVGAKPYAVAVGDFNGDGKQDLAVSSIGSDTVSILLGNGDGTFARAVEYPAGATPHGIAVGDFNGDGKLDLAVCNLSSNTVSVLLGNGDGSFQAPVPYATGDARGVAVGDFNGDGKQDLVVANPKSNTVSVILGNGDGTFQKAVHYSNDGSPISVAVADFNGDGKLDLVVSNSNGNTVSVRLGKGDGTFQTVNYYPVGSGPGAVVVGDFDGDGRTDIAVENFGTHDVSVLLGKGDGTFQPAASYPAGIGPGGLVAGDFNGDGVPDLAVANHHSNDVSILLGNGDGTFRRPIHFAAGGTPAGIAVGDFRGNGAADVAVVNHLSDNVSVLLNRPPAPHFLIQAPHHVNSGEDLGIDVTAVDASNNIETSYRGTVHMAFSDKHASFATREFAFGAAHVGVHNNHWGKLRTAGAQTVIITDKANPERVGSITIDVAPGPATHFRVSAPKQSVAGQPFRIFVTAMDEFDNTAGGYSGRVQLGSTDERAELPSDYAFQGIDYGRHAFTLKLNTVGKRTITVTDTGSGTITGSTTVVVEK